MHVQIFFFFFRITPCSEGGLDYDPREILRLYVGLNEANLEDALSRNRMIYEYKVEKVCEMRDKQCMF